MDIVPGRDLPPPHCSQEFVSLLELAVSGGPDHRRAGAPGVPPTTLSLEGNLREESLLESLWGGRPGSQGGWQSQVRGDCSLGSWVTKEWGSRYQGLRSWGDATPTRGPSGPATSRSGSPPGGAGTTPSPLMLHPRSGHRSLNGCLLRWGGRLSEPTRDQGSGCLGCWREHRCVPPPEGRGHWYPARDRI